jgi:hypothetical protein
MLLIPVPFMPTLEPSRADRFSISQMDVPTPESIAVVDPDDGRLPGVTGITHWAAASPRSRAALCGASFVWAPFVIAAHHRHDCS